MRERKKEKERKRKKEKEKEEREPKDFKPCCMSWIFMFENNQNNKNNKEKRWENLRRRDVKKCLF